MPRLTASAAAGMVCLRTSFHAAPLRHTAPLRDVPAQALANPPPCLVCGIKGCYKELSLWGRSSPDPLVSDKGGHHYPRLGEKVKNWEHGGHHCIHLSHGSFQYSKLASRAMHRRAGVVSSRVFMASCCSRHLRIPLWVLLGFALEVAAVIWLVVQGVARFSARAALLKALSRLRPSPGSLPASIAGPSCLPTLTPSWGRFTGQGGRSMVWDLGPAFHQA